MTMTLNENWIEFSLRYVVDYKERRGRKHRIFARILEDFEKTEGRVEIASTSTDINLTQMPSLKVGLSGGGSFETPTAPVIDTVGPAGHLCRNCY